MSKNQKSIASRFSASSTSYDQAVVIQPIVVDKIFKMIMSAGAVDRVLEIGCGTGLLTKKIITHFPSARIDAVDISGKMIARSKTQLAAHPGIRWLISDIMNLPETTMYPLIVSSSALHWINPVEAGLAKCACLLKKDGCFISAMMVQGTLGELHASRLRVAPHKPPRQSLPSMREIRHALQNTGFRILDIIEDVTRVNHPSAEVLLRRIHDQGSTGGPISISTFPMNRKELHDLSSDYNACYKSDSGVYATYRVVYFRVVKKN